MAILVRKLLSWEQWNLVFNDSEHCCQVGEGEAPATEAESFVTELFFLRTFPSALHARYFYFLKTI